MRLGAKQIGWFSMAAAVVGVLAAALGRNADSVTAITVGLVLALFGLATGGIALRTAVRTDAGVPHALFGLAFGFLALVLAVFLLGAQRGGVYSG